MAIFLIFLISKGRKNHFSVIHFLKKSTFKMYFVNCIYLPYSSSLDVVTGSITSPLNYQMPPIDFFGEHAKLEPTSF